MLIFTTPKPSIGVNIDRGISDGGMTRMNSYPVLTMTPLKCKQHGTISPSGMHFFFFFLSRSEHFGEFLEPYNNSLMPRVPYWWSQIPSLEAVSVAKGEMCIDKFRVRLFFDLPLLCWRWWLMFEILRPLLFYLWCCFCVFCCWFCGWFRCWSVGFVLVLVLVVAVVVFVVGCWLLLLVVGCWLLIADCWLLIVVVLCIAHYEMHIHHSRGMCCIMLLGSQRPREVLFGHIGRQTDVSWNMGTPKSSILIELSIINHPAIGVPTFMETTQIDAYRNKDLTKLDFWLVSSSKMFAMLLRQQASKQCSCLKSGSQYTTLRWAVGLAN